MKRSISFVTIIAASFALAACSKGVETGASKASGANGPTQMSPAFIQKYEAYMGVSEPAKRQALALEMVQVSQTGKDLQTAIDAALETYGLTGFREKMKPVVASQALKVDASPEQLADIVNDYYTNVGDGVQQMGLPILAMAYELAEKNPTTTSMEWYSIYRAGQSNPEYEQLANKARAKGKIAEAREESGGR